MVEFPRKRRIKKEPKYGKYIYQYTFKVDSSGFIGEYLGKSKFLVCYRDGQRVYFKRKDANAPMLSTKLKRITSFDITEFKELFEHCFNGAFVIIYSYDNVYSEDLNKILKYNSDEIIRKNIEDDIERINKEIKRKNEEYDIEIKRLESAKENLLRKIKNLGEK